MPYVPEYVKFKANVKVNKVLNMDRLISHKDILKSVSDWSVADIQTLIQSLNSVVFEKDRAANVAKELEALANKNGFSMAALGFVREVASASDKIPNRKRRTLTATNQSYYVDGDVIKIAAGRKRSMLKATGELLNYDDLNGEQQNKADALIASLNSA